MPLLKVFLIIIFFTCQISAASYKSDGPEGAGQCAQILKFPSPDDQQIATYTEIEQHLEDAMSTSDASKVIGFPQNLENAENTESDALDSYIDEIGAIELIVQLTEIMPSKLNLAQWLERAAKAMILHQYDKNTASERGVDSGNVESYDLASLNRLLHTVFEFLTEKLEFLILNQQLIEKLEKMSDFRWDLIQQPKKEFESILHHLAFVAQISADPRFPKPTELLKSHWLTMSLPEVSQETIDNEFAEPSLLIEREESYDAYFNLAFFSIKSDFDGVGWTYSFMGLHQASYDEYLEKNKTAKATELLDEEIPSNLESFHSYAMGTYNRIIEAGQLLLESPHMHHRKKDAERLVDSIRQWRIEFSLEKENFNMERVLRAETLIYDHSLSKRPLIKRIASRMGAPGPKPQSLFSSSEGASLKALSDRLVEKFDLPYPERTFLD